MKARGAAASRHPADTGSCQVRAPAYGVPVISAVSLSQQMLFFPLAAAARPATPVEAVGAGLAQCRPDESRAVGAADAAALLRGILVIPAALAPAGRGQAPAADRLAILGRARTLRAKAGRPLPGRMRPRLKAVLLSALSAAGRAGRPDIAAAAALANPHGLQVRQVFLDALGVRQLGAAH